MHFSEITSDIVDQRVYIEAVSLALNTAPPSIEPKKLTCSPQTVPEGKHALRSFQKIRYDLEKRLQLYPKRIETSLSTPDPFNI
jgi:hypothetical protein